jgi:hypothetical protein
MGSMSPNGPTLPTCALQQVVSYPGETGRDANVTAKAARDPEETLDHAPSCNGESYNCLAIAAYLITSSATASNVGGISGPSPLAVFMLIASWYLVGCWTGRTRRERSVDQFPRAAERVLRGSGLRFFGLLLGIPAPKLFI